MEIQKVTDTAFAKYGKVMSDIPVERILKEMEHTPLPEDVIYVPSVEALEVLPDAVAVREKGFGGLPIQIGYCNGSNVKLNALEYHRSSEIDIAVTDLILLLGCQQDIKEDTYDTALVEAFSYRQERQWNCMRLRYIMHHVMQKQAVSDVWSYFRRERMRHFRLHRKQRARADF